ncbi:hypothetical protein [Brachybacterium tyrofermentans]
MRKKILHMIAAHRTGARAGSSFARVRGEDTDVHGCEADIPPDAV